MKSPALLRVFLLSTLACCTALSQDRGNWRPASSTAKGITGDIALTGEKIAINFSAFTIASIRPLQPAEVLAVFNEGPAQSAVATLYRLNIPGEKRFLHRNTLCGSEDTQWLITYATGRDLRLAFFSGAKMPILTPEAVSSSTDLCGTFSYVR